MCSILKHQSTSLFRLYVSFSIPNFSVPSAIRPVPKLTLAIPFYVHLHGTNPHLSPAFLLHLASVPKEPWNPPQWKQSWKNQTCGYLIIWDDWKFHLKKLPYAQPSKYDNKLCHSVTCHAARLGNQSSKKTLHYQGALRMLHCLSLQFKWNSPAAKTILKLFSFTSKLCLKPDLRDGNCAHVAWW